MPYTDDRRHVVIRERADGMARLHVYAYWMT
jgi:hypothetical protein